MKKLVVHAGRSKTGTSYLQAIFAKNAEQLKKRGISYQAFGQAFGRKDDMLFASNGGITSGNCVLPALAICSPSLLRDGITAGDVIADFKDELSKIEEDTVLISSEFFERLNKKTADILQNIAKQSGRDLEVVIYLRPQIQAIQSIYAQGLKRHHETHRFDEFFAKFPFPALDYYNWLEQLAEAIGRDRLVVRPFLRDQFYGNSIASDFFKWSALPINEIDDFDILSGTYVNPTPSPKELELLRLSNVYKPPLWFLNSVLQAYSDIAEHKENRIRLLTADQLDTILNHYREQNQMMVSKYFIGADGIENSIFFSGGQEFIRDEPKIKVTKKEIFQVMVGVLSSKWK